MNLNSDLLQYIATFDYSIAYALSDWGVPILASLGRDPKFIEYCIQHDHVHLLREFVPTIEKEDALEMIDTAVLYNSIHSLIFIYDKYPNAMDSDFETDYAIFALHHNYLDIFYFFLDCTEMEIDADDFRILTEAVESDRYSVVEYILNHRKMEPYADVSAAMITAIENKNYACLDLIVNHPNVEPHEPDNAALREAIAHQDDRSIMIFLNNGDVLRNLQLYEEEWRYIRAAGFLR